MPLIIAGRSYTSSAVSERVPQVTVIGGGPAGTEAAWQLAEAGLHVALVDGKPTYLSPAHQTPLLCELVCSNSLRSDEETSPAGLLKRELRRAGSLMIDAADRQAVDVCRMVARIVGPEFRIVELKPDGAGGVAVTPGQMEESLLHVRGEPARIELVELPERRASRVGPHRRLGQDVGHQPGLARRRDSDASMWPS